MTDDSETELHRTVFSAPNQGSSAPRSERLPVLVVMRGAQVGRRYLLNENSLVLGRREDRAALVVPGDPQISSVHCRVERGAQPDSWQVVDLSSTNGTFVGTERVTTMTLRDGDRIHLGTTVLKFCYHDELEEEFHRQVDHLMNVDDLTGLPVQRVFQTRFADALIWCARRQRPLAHYMMDMDGLKRINDTHGHLLGAHTIATVGKRLGAIVQQIGGVVSRFGGDEFSAFVPDLDRDGALRLGETMRAAVAGEAIARGTAMAQPTISIGVACFPDDGRLPEQLTRKADEALYRAKAAGRDRVSE
ncbi:MAG: diguanylate cyclase [Planctomycetes bacterium]|nr:diguanylate cyclase [Planctomycetota bacterium]